MDSLLVLGAVLVALLLLTCYLYRPHRERFATKQAHDVSERAREVFDASGGAAPYSLYKMRVPAADPVLYSDTRALWKKGALTPDSVQSVL